MSTISVFWSFVVVVWNLKQMVNEHSNDFEMKKIFFKWKNEWIGWKSAKGGTRVWTGDLSICSRMLYHWAIPPIGIPALKFLLFVNALLSTTLLCRYTKGCNKSFEIVIWTIPVLPVSLNPNVQILTIAQIRTFITEIIVSFY